MICVKCARAADIGVQQTSPDALPAATPGRPEVLARILAGIARVVAGLHELCEGNGCCCQHKPRPVSHAVD